MFLNLTILFHPINVIQGIFWNQWDALNGFPLHNHLKSLALIDQMWDLAALGELTPMLVIGTMVKIQNQLIYLAALGELIPRW